MNLRKNVKQFLLWTNYWPKSDTAISYFCMHRTICLCFQNALWHLEVNQLALFYIKLNNLEALQTQEDKVKWEARYWKCSLNSEYYIPSLLHNEINVHSFLKRVARKNTTHPSKCEFRINNFLCVHALFVSCIWITWRAC